MQTIYLDISNKGVIPTVYAKQNDVGRKFAVILTDSGLPYIPVSGSAFSVWYKGASGEGNYTDIGDKSAFSLNGNKVEVEMIVQMLSTHGDGILCMTLNSPDGNQISSWNIPYMCEIVPGSESEKAEEYYTAFSESVEKLKQVTENLTPEAIGAAPAGYGLGTDCQYIGSWNDATKSGFYKSNGNAPDAYWWWGHVDPYDVNNGVQVAFREENGVLVECHRLISEGVPKEWEWDNPPMVPGVEYRTTRRRKGKPIYTKLLEFSPSVFAEQVTISGHGISNFDTGVLINVDWLRANGNEWRHFPSSYFGNNDWSGQAYWSGVTNLVFELGVHLLSNIQGSPQNILATLEYTKST